MIAICLHLLSNLPVGLINVYDHRKIWIFSALTTLKLAQCFYEEGIITDKKQVEEVLSVDNAEGTVAFLGSKKYDLERKDKQMTCSELADRIVLSDAIHIYC